jgi:hypothetical protein
MSCAPVSRETIPSGALAAAAAEMKRILEREPQLGAFGFDPGIR